MKKKIRGDTVYGEEDLIGILDKEAEPIVETFSKEAKGSDTLRKMYMQSLLRGIGKLKKHFKEENEEKRRKSDSIRNGSLNVTMVGMSEL